MRHQRSTPVTKRTREVAALPSVINGPAYLFIIGAVFYDSESSTWKTFRVSNESL
jgi:hypothetical protein